MRAYDNIFMTNARRDTLRCGCAQWEHDLMGGPCGTNLRPRTLAERTEARETKRRNEWIKSAQKVAEGRAKAQRTVATSTTTSQRPALDKGERDRETGLLIVADLTRTERAAKAPYKARPVHQPTHRLRVHEIAAEIDRTPAETVELLRAHGEWVQGPNSVVVWPAARDFFATQMGA